MAETQATTATEWFYEEKGERKGPVSEGEIIQFIESSVITRGTCVWRQGFPEWLKIENTVLRNHLDLSIPSQLDTVHREKNNQESEESRAGSNRPHSIHETDLPFATVAPKKKVGFISKHWRGDYSLGFSYWVIGALLTVVVTLVLTLIGETKLLGSLSPRISGGVIFCVYSFLILVTLWQLVGIWKSADFHKGRGGKSTWANLAKFGVVLGLLRFSGDMVSEGFPLMAQGIKLAISEEQIPAHEIRILRDGAELELAGGMPSGTTNDIRKFLDATPAIKVIHLNSSGGWLTEAYALHQLIKDRRLITYTSTSCTSACAIAFIGGSERYLGERGRIGFHSASIGSIDGETFKQINDAVSKTLRDSGVPNSFIERAIRTSAKDMWYPTNKELLDAHVINAVVDSRLFALSGVKDWRDAYKIDQSLLQIPAYAALAKYDPKNYQKFRDDFVQGIQRGKSHAEIASAGRARLMTLVPTYLRIAPDKELIRYWKTQITEIKALAKIDPKLCASHLYPEYGGTAPDLQRLLPKEILADDLDALAGLIQAASERPVLIDEVRGKNGLMLAMADVGKTAPSALPVISDMERFKSDSRALCGATLSLYSAILKLPTESMVGTTLRYLLNAS